MLKKINFPANLKEDHQDRLQVGVVGLGDIKKSDESLLKDFMGPYKSASINDPLTVFNEKVLKEKASNIDYGVLKLLEGTWYSYNERGSSEGSSGVHTTILPSPGTNQNKNPGKFSFDCEEYLEKLHFELIPDPIRNRGGATEQFCGALKYDQSIKTVSKSPDSKGMFPGIHEENGMFLWMSDIMNHAASKESIEEDRGVHQWNTDSGKEVLAGNIFPACAPFILEKKRLEIECKDATEERKQEIDARIIVLESLIEPFKLKVQAMVEVHPYLDVTFFNVGTFNNPEYVTQEDLDGRSYISILPAKELKPNDGLDGGHFIPDYSISRSGIIPHGSAITLLGNVSRNANREIVQQGKPEFIAIGPLAKQVIKILEDAGVSNYNQIEERLNTVKDKRKLMQIVEVFAEVALKSNVLSELLQKAALPNDENSESYDELLASIKSILKQEAINNQWDYNHLAIDRTMGGGKNSTNQSKKDIPKDLVRPFDLDNPPLPFTPLEELNYYNDEGENIVYTQRMFMHDLYPYSIRPDLRLRDAIANQNVKQYVHFQLNSKNKTGQQGGILNIPFINKFIPTVEMNMNMWIEEVEENGQTFLQLQYEQIVFFEFGFGDNGGTTSWPHIQVNTLRKYENLNAESKKLVDSQFLCPQREALLKQIISTPEIITAQCPNSDSDKENLTEQLALVKEELISKCPFHK